MGFGDAILAAGAAQRMFAEAPERGPITICGCDGFPRWRPEWAGNPAIRAWVGKLNPAWPTLRFGGGCLPYYPWHRGITWRARDHRATMYFTPEELQLGLNVRAQHGPFLLIEPTGRDRKNKNRFWPSANWHALARLLRERLPEWPLVQLDRPAADRIRGIPGIPHESFREACAILKAAHLAILPEGGIAIGAAAVGTQAVVLWGGLSSVEHFGYPEHVNLVDDDPRTPCGSSKPCDHCAAAWAKLTPEHVADAVEAKLRNMAPSNAGAKETCCGIR